ncbi:MAG: hypothetical protein U1E48_14745 [Paracoccaceae bacterium]
MLASSPALALDHPRYDIRVIFQQASRARAGRGR